MTADFSIRLARPNEVERLGRIEDRASMLFEGTDVFGDLNGEIFNPNELLRLIELGQVWVACGADDLPVGFIILVNESDILHIEELDVIPEFGRRGIGAWLLQHVCRWARENGFRAATLSTFRDIPWNAPFYATHGFRILEPHDFTPWMTHLREIEASKGLRIETRVIMQRPLS